MFEQRGQDFPRLLPEIFSARGGLLHHAQPLIQRFVHQRFEQARFIAKIVIERRLGTRRRPR